MPDMANPEFAQDMLHKALMHEVDSKEMAFTALRGAIFEVVDALAWLDGNPNRAEYIKSLAEVSEVDDPEPYTAWLVTAASWARDTVLSEEVISDGGAA